MTKVKVVCSWLRAPTTGSYSPISDSFMLCAIQIHVIREAQAFLEFGLVPRCGRFGLCIVSSKAE